MTTTWHEQACVQHALRVRHVPGATAIVNDITGEEHVALVKGDLGDGRDVLCRVHSECLTGDVFGSKRCDCGEQLHAALAARSRRKDAACCCTCARKAAASG